jgi:hypothetical protein
MGVGPKTAEELAKRGFDTPEKLAAYAGKHNWNPDILRGRLGINARQISAIEDYVRGRLDLAPFERPPTSPQEARFLSENKVSMHEESVYAAPLGSAINPRGVKWIDPSRAFLENPTEEKRTAVTEALNRATRIYNKRARQQFESMSPEEKAKRGWNAPAQMSWRQSTLGSGQPALEVIRRNESGEIENRTFVTAAATPTGITQVFVGGASGGYALIPQLKLSDKSIDAFGNLIRQKTPSGTIVQGTYIADPGFSFMDAFASEETPSAALQRYGFQHIGYSTASPGKVTQIAASVQIPRSTEVPGLGTKRFGEQDIEDILSTLDSELGGPFTQRGGEGFAYDVNGMGRIFSKTRFVNGPDNQLVPSDETNLSGYSPRDPKRLQLRYNMRQGWDIMEAPGTERERNMQGVVLSGSGHDIRETGALNVRFFLGQPFPEGQAFVRSRLVGRMKEHVLEGTSAEELKEKYNLEAGNVYTHGIRYRDLGAWTRGDKYNPEWEDIDEIPGLGGRSSLAEATRIENIIEGDDGKVTVITRELARLSSSELKGPPKAMGAMIQEQEGEEILPLNMDAAAAIPGSKDLIATATEAFKMLPPGEAFEEMVSVLRGEAPPIVDPFTGEEYAMQKFLSESGEPFNDKEIPRFIRALDTITGLPRQLSAEGLRRVFNEHPDTYRVFADAAVVEAAAVRRFLGNIKIAEVERRVSPTKMRALMEAEKRRRAMYVQRLMDQGMSESKARAAAYRNKGAWQRIRQIEKDEETGIHTIKMRLPYIDAKLPIAVIPLSSKGVMRVTPEMLQQLSSIQPGVYKNLVSNLRRSGLKSIHASSMQAYLLNTGQAQSEAIASSAIDITGKGAGTFFGDYAAALASAKEQFPDAPEAGITRKALGIMSRQEQYSGRLLRAGETYLPSLSTIAKSLTLNKKDKLVRNFATGALNVIDAAREMYSAKTSIGLTSETELALTSALRQRASEFTGELSEFFQNPSVVASAFENQVEAVAGAARSHSAIPAGIAVMNTRDAARLIYAAPEEAAMETLKRHFGDDYSAPKGISARSHLLRLFHRGNVNLEALAVMYPGSNQELQYVPQTVVSNRVASQKYGVYAEPGATMLSEGSVMVFGKDFDADRFAMMLNLGKHGIDNWITPQKYKEILESSPAQEYQNIVEKAASNSFIPDIIDRAMIRPFSGQEFVENARASRASKAAMGSEYNPFIRGFTQFTSRLLDEAGVKNRHKTRFAVGFAGQSIYQKAVDLEPSRDPSVNWFRKMYNNAIIYSNPNQPTQLSPGLFGGEYGSFTELGEAFGRAPINTHDEFANFIINRAIRMGMRHYGTEDEEAIMRGQEEYETAAEHWARSLMPVAKQTNKSVARLAGKLKEISQSRYGEELTNEELTEMLGASPAELVFGSTVQNGRQQEAPIGTSSPLISHLMGRITNRVTERWDKYAKEGKGAYAGQLRGVLDKFIKPMSRWGRIHKSISAFKRISKGADVNYYLENLRKAGEEFSAVAEIERMFGIPGAREAEMAPPPTSREAESALPTPKSQQSVDENLVFNSLPGGNIIDPRDYNAAIGGAGGASGSEPPQPPPPEYSGQPPTPGYPGRIAVQFPVMPASEAEIRRVATLHDRLARAVDLYRQGKLSPGDIRPEWYGAIKSMHNVVTKMEKRQNLLTEQGQEGYDGPRIYHHRADDYFIEAFGGASGREWPALERAMTEEIDGRPSFSQIVAQKYALKSLYGTKKPLNDSEREMARGYIHTAREFLERIPELTEAFAKPLGFKEGKHLIPREALTRARLGIGAIKKLGGLRERLQILDQSGALSPEDRKLFGEISGAMPGDELYARIVGRMEASINRYAAAQDPRRVGGIDLLGRRVTAARTILGTVDQKELSRLKGMLQPLIGAGSGRLDKDVFERIKSLSAAASTIATTKERLSSMPGELDERAQEVLEMVSGAGLDDTFSQQLLQARELIRAGAFKPESRSAELTASEIGETRGYAAVLKDIGQEGISQITAILANPTIGPAGEKTVPRDIGRRARVVSKSIRELQRKRAALERKGIENLTGEERELYGSITETFGGIDPDSIKEFSRAHAGVSAGLIRPRTAQEEKEPPIVPFSKALDRMRPLSVVANLGRATGDFRSPVDIDEEGFKLKAGDTVKSLGELAKTLEKLHVVGQDNNQTFIQLAKALRQIDVNYTATVNKLRSGRVSQEELSPDELATMKTVETMRFGELGGRDALGEIMSRFERYAQRVESGEVGITPEQPGASKLSILSDRSKRGAAMREEAFRSGMFDRFALGRLGRPELGVASARAASTLLRGGKFFMSGYGLWMGRMVQNMAFQPLVRGTREYSQQKLREESLLASSGIISGADILSGVGGDVLRRRARMDEYNYQMGRAAYNTIAGYQDIATAFPFIREAAKPVNTVVKPALGAGVLAGVAFGTTAGIGSALVVGGGFLAAQMAGASKSYYDQGKGAGFSWEGFAGRAWNTGKWIATKLLGGKTDEKYEKSPEYAKIVDAVAAGQMTVDEAREALGQTFTGSEINLQVYDLFARQAADIGLSREQAGNVIQTYYNFNRAEAGRTYSGFNQIKWKLAQLSFSGIDAGRFAETYMQAMRFSPIDWSRRSGALEAVTNNLYSSERPTETAAEFEYKMSALAPINATRDLYGLIPLTDIKTFEDQGMQEVYGQWSAWSAVERVKYGAGADISRITLAEEAINSGQEWIAKSLIGASPRARITGLLSSGAIASAKEAEYKFASAERDLMTGQSVYQAYGQNELYNTVSMMMYAGISGAGKYSLEQIESVFGKRVGAAERGFDLVNLARMQYTASTGGVTPTYGDTAATLNLLLSGGYSLDDLESMNLAAPQFTQLNQIRRLSGRAGIDWTPARASLLLRPEVQQAALGYESLAGSMYMRGTGSEALLETGAVKAATDYWRSPVETLRVVPQIQSVASAYEQITARGFQAGTKTLDVLGGIAAGSSADFNRAMAIASGDKFALANNWQSFVGAMGQDSRAMTPLEAVQFKLISPTTGLQTFETGVDSLEYSWLQDWAARYGREDWLIQQGEEGYGALLGGRRGIETRLRDIRLEQVQRQRAYQQWQRQTNWAVRSGGASGVDAQGFALGGDGLAFLKQLMSSVGYNFNVGNGMGMWQLEDANTMLAREQQMFSWRQQGQSLALSERQFSMQSERFYARRDLQKEKLEYSERIRSQELGRAREKVETQFGWQEEDLQYNRDMSQLQFSWQLQDYDENIRYARGRQRRVLMRQRERSVVRFAMQQGQLSRQEDRLDVRRRWAEEEQRVREEQHNRTIEWQRREMEMSERYFEEDRELQRQRLDMQQEAHQRQLGWMNERWAIEDQRRLIERQMTEVQTIEQNKYIMSVQASEDATRRLTESLSVMNSALSDAASKVAAMSASFGLLNMAGTSSQRVSSAASTITQRASSYFSSIRDRISSFMPSTVSSHSPPQASSGRWVGGVRVDAYTPSTAGGMTAAQWYQWKLANGYASGGYTGDGKPWEVAGVVHKGEYVVPQHGALVMQAGEQEELLREIRDILAAIKERGLANLVFNYQGNHVSGVVGYAEKMLDQTYQVA